MSPIILEYGPFQIRWYGVLVALSFLSGIIITYYYGRRYNIKAEILDRIMIRIVLAMIVGARLGYVVANYSFFLDNPHLIPRVDMGGLGSHGGIITCLILGIWWSKRLKFSFWSVCDAVAPVIPLAHIFVRLGNFINAELYGPPTELPWGVVFRGEIVPHHPSQLYEAGVSLIILPLVF